MLEHHLDPSKIKGTGKDGRLTKDDVLAAAEAQKAEPASARRRPARSAAAPASAPQQHGRPPALRRANARKSGSA